MNSMVEIKKLPPGYAIGYTPVGMPSMSNSDIESIYQDTLHVIEAINVLGAGSAETRNKAESALFRKTITKDRLNHSRTNPLDHISC